MTTQELLEHAVLDAMGLLEGREQTVFDDAWESATPEIQALVRREQARLAQLERLLPDVGPPADLKAAVIAAVRRAMADAEEPEPMLARLGQAIAPRSRVSPLWRAASLGLAAAAVVFGVVTVQFASKIGELERRAINIASYEEARKLGENFERVLFDPAYRKVAFESDRSAGSGRAAMFVDAEGRTATFFCRNLPALDDGRTYKLVVLDDQGRVEQELPVDLVAGDLTAQTIDMNAVSGERLAVVPRGSADARGAAVLSVSIAALLTPAG